MASIVNKRRISNLAKKKEKIDGDDDGVDTIAILEKTIKGKVDADNQRLELVTRLEGNIQKSYKASYPPGNAKEDWQIINDLAEFMNNRKLFNDKDELESGMFNYLKMNKDQQISELDHQLNESDFTDEILKVDFKDYYFSNVIARSSKTMLECNNAKIDLKKTGTEG